MKKPPGDDRILIAENRKARERYKVEDKFEAGVVLVGTEVKALRAGKAQLAESFAQMHRDELYLMNMHVAAYSHGGYTNHEPTRERKLLLHRHEIEKLRPKLERRGYTLIPLELYFKKGRVKVQLGLCVGKDSVDRRAEIKERDTKKEIAKVMKGATRR